MNTVFFKKHSKTTYVWIKGDPRCIVVPSSTSSNSPSYKTTWLIYSGYIEVPYSYDDFIAFSEKQRKAICQAELSKAGWCVQITECNPDSFFDEESQQ